MFMGRGVGVIVPATLLRHNSGLLGTGPKVKNFFILNSAEHEIYPAH